jgi:hypothetical protein
MAARRVLAACDVPSERRRAAALDRTHDFQLVEAHMATVGLTPSGTVVAEDVRDLQSWSNHNRRRYRAGGFLVLVLRFKALKSLALPRGLEPLFSP